MIAIKNGEDRVKSITRIVSKLSTDEQEALLKGLEKKSLLEKAKRLAGAVADNKLTIQDIVAEVMTVRAEA